MIRSNDQKTPDKIRLDERSHVENPLLDQLETQGWEVLRLEMAAPASASARADFNEVVLGARLRAQLAIINRFLEPDQIEDVVQKLTVHPVGDLIENNRKVFELLTQNTSVGENRKTGEVSPTVKYIDFETPGNNSFVAICQFKVRIPGTDHHIIPDITLFINGIPVAVIECKSSKIKEPIPEAIDQLMRYSQQRGESSEGNAELFYYNQILVATCRTHCKFGSITTTSEKHFYRWTDPYPMGLEELPSQGTSPNDQQRLVAGMFTKENLLSLIRTFTLFSTNDKGDTIKIVGRYQQFKAVKKSIKRLMEGQNAKERSGIIWHTQGSGKSLTMMFMVREMRHHLKLQGWKIVFITDRTQLEDQLSTTGTEIGESVKVADNIRDLKKLIKSDNADVVLGMIQKFQERDLNELFPILNTSPNILVMIDEAHRGQYDLLGANLDRAMPHATRIGYTGTPIEKTKRTFGDYIDMYTMRQSIDDGTTLEIVYELRTHNAEVEDVEGMDQRFTDVFSDYKLSERLQILGFGTKEAYLEAEQTIKAKAADMVQHWVSYVFPGGFKAQVVATSQEAAVRYKYALEEALKELVGKLKHSNPNSVDIDLLEKVEVGCVISGTSNNDRPHIKAHGDPKYHKRVISRFKRSFRAKEGEEDGFVGIVVVNNMLLTGFDAPIEQVLYLDKVVTDHNLLQAIARVNRVGDDGKDKGMVVDYVGVGHHLKRALNTYAAEEQEEIFNALSDPDKELGELKVAHEAVWALLKEHGIHDLTDTDAIFDLFYDENIRFDYISRFKKLTAAFNIVLPRKEALDYWHEYLNFVEINTLAQRHFQDSRLSMKGIPAKLRQIADQFLMSKGITLKVEPISILDDDFEKGVKARNRTRTKAAEVEHAIRHYIDENIDEDPELFASFAEALRLILEEFKNNWEKIYEELEKLRAKIKEKEREETFGLHRKRQMPVLKRIRGPLFPDGDHSPEQHALMVNLAAELSDCIITEIRAVGFWSSPPAQNKLKSEIQALVLAPQYSELKAFGKRDEIITRLMEWAREKHRTLVAD
jgi:type I restriction enzyme, R subunit